MLSRVNEHREPVGRSAAQVSRDKFDRLIVHDSIPPRPTGPNVPRPGHTQPTSDSWATVAVAVHRPGETRRPEPLHTSGLAKIVAAAIESIPSASPVLATPPPRTS